MRVEEGMAGKLRGFLVATTLTLATSAALAATGDGKLGPACGSIPGETLAKDRLGRIFQHDVRYGYALDGCLYRGGRVVRLFPTRRDDGGNCGTLGLARMRRDKAAFVYDSCGGGGGVYYATVKVVDLGSGKVVHRRFSPQDAGSSVSSLVLKPNGSAAWIRDDCPDPPYCWAVVVKADHTRRHRLDIGADIDRHSLSLHGSRITWTKGGVRRTASLE
jgi:hypothetical protein